MSFLVSVVEEMYDVSDDDLQKLENFVVLMYDRSSTATGVDEARMDLFARKQRSRVGSYGARLLSPAQKPAVLQTRVGIK